LVDGDSSFVEKRAIPSVDERVAGMPPQGTQRDLQVVLQHDNEGLEEEGFRSESAENGHEALDILRSRPIDLVVTDYQMPLMSGLELIRAIKIQPVFEHIPTILVTGIPDTHILSLAEKFGAYRTFFKPFNFGDLVHAIHAALSRPDPPVSGDSDHKKGPQGYDPDIAG